ncbi:adenine deaminase [Polycladidibacter hongkongensis]|uniref:adenine deaminase n=1 Tax=Polycladidibacter hongkongensis TaxID=1647556 RepID=UPI0009EBF8F3|nr:adenine deaminase [Pseudovibrio hongkongensis]
MSELARRIRQGQGQEPADLVLKSVELFNVVDGSLELSDIAICGETIVGCYGTYEGNREVDCTGLYAVPGFIDSHLHVESSLVTPLEFDRCVLPHGVTTAICDPHEIANVVGAPGIAYFLEAARATLMDLRVNLSSCVPATAFETAGARLDMAQLAPFMDDEKVIGLAEMMNFPGVLACDPVVMAKLEAFAEGHIDGHAPLLRGLALNGYLSAGITTDHEATTYEEGLEKLRKGMRLFIREGSVSKDLEALAGLVTPEFSSFVSLCTDDRNPLDIAEEGHLDSMIRRLLAKGLRPVDVYRAASWSAAQAFGLKDRGLLAPGYRADIALLADLHTCDVGRVVCGGLLVEDGHFASRPQVAFGHLLDSCHAKDVVPDDFTVHARGEQSVIGVEAGLIITHHERYELHSENGVATVDVARDLLKVAVVERHGKNGNVACGFVRGFGLERGAIASSVGHDSHNICVVGADEVAMARAVNRLNSLGGGFVVADGPNVLAELALPIAGLMSDQPFEVVKMRLEALRAAAIGLGCTLPEPFLQVAFLPLPVIPHLKITDKGLFDVDRFAMVPQG